MRATTDADRRARASAIALTRTQDGSRALSAMWQSFKLPSHDLRSQASSIAAPTVLVWGRRDPIVTPKCGEAANKLIAGSKLVILDSGHAPQTTNPAAVAAELVPLLDAAFPGDGPTEPTEAASLLGRGGQR
jgi:pimeloyl-ACP methyl ester carboxylesterase